MLLNSLRLCNFLSYGPDAPEVLLQPLNILIGANGSGKSNFIEGICVLRETAGDIQKVLRKGGGVTEWVGKSRPQEPANIEAIVANKADGIYHKFEFATENQTFSLIDEKVEDAILEKKMYPSLFFYRYQHGRPLIDIKKEKHKIPSDSINGNQSILSQRRDPELYPEITYLGDQYRQIRIYREWQFGRNSIFRTPQRADLPNEHLEEDFSNLGLFLNRLRGKPEAKNKLLTYLRDLYEDVEDFDVSIQGNTVQVFFTEGNYTIPATRLSDGTLRYLCLLAILCDPTPPPLICIEEPELGLHPDILPKIADLLREASERTQLIITTHSDILVDAMTETPEAILVCEKHEKQTHLHRLSREELSVWLEKYRLGELWTRGEIGGNRW
jgi:predicted ATPase